MKDNSMVALLKSRKTVFSVKDLALVWDISDVDYLKTKIHRLVKKKGLARIRKGIYIMNEGFDPEELANKMVSPSYISLQTVLLKEGIIFQYDSAIYSVSEFNKTIKIKKQYFYYKKARESILLNSKGIEVKNDISIATKERAICDTLYFYKDFYFDNLDDVDWEKCLDIGNIYNKSLVKKIERLKKTYAK